MDDDWEPDWAAGPDPFEGRPLYRLYDAIISRIRRAWYNRFPPF